jgi:hypothetical protein
LCGKAYDPAWSDNVGVERALYRLWVFDEILERVGRVNVTNRRRVAASTGPASAR